MPNFTFDPLKHEYKFGDIRLPGVTKILNTWIRIKIKGMLYCVHTQTGAAIDADTFEYAGARGRAIHDGAKLIIEKNLDWDILDPLIVSQLRQFEAWGKKYIIGPDPVICEIPMMSHRWMYAGTPDIITLIKGVMSVIDIKSGTYGQVAAQVAAYEQLFRETTSYRKQIDLYVLDLSGKKYHFQQIKDANAWPFFLNCLGRFKYLTQKK